MHKYLSKIFISCKQATRLMSDAMERDLTWRERVALKCHIIVCGMCLHWGTQVESVQELMHDYEKVIERFHARDQMQLSETTCQRLRSAIQREINPQ